MLQILDFKEYVPEMIFPNLNYLQNNFNFSDVVINDLYCIQFVSLNYFFHDIS